MALLELLLLATAVSAAAAVPCVAIRLLCRDESAMAAVRAVLRPWSRWRLRRHAAVPADPPIERLAADLRRLSRLRMGVATRSPVWFTAVQRAFDDRLAAACRELGVSEHLADLAGVDREIERLRVEGALLDAGLVLRDAETRRWYGPR